MESKKIFLTISFICLDADKCIFRMEGFGHYVEEVGRPYLWAQWLCGLRFLQQTADKPGSRADESLSASYMEATIIKLRSRIRARLALQKQLFALGILFGLTLA